MSVWDIPADRPQFDVLVVAGDLITRAERGVRWLRDRFPASHVIYVLGNHERYGTDAVATLDKARLAAEGSSVHVLENDSVEIGGVEFLGATFWTDFALLGDATVGDAMRAAEDRMNDYRTIRIDGYARKLRAADTLGAHRASVAFIRERCARDPARRRVIVTHHSVDPLAIPLVLRNDLLGAGYSSRLLDLVEELHPDCWLSGHIHQSSDRLVGRTRLISNAKGYGPFSNRDGGIWQNPRFDPRFTFAL
jgi:Icc-related predicted phosphoesterase